MRSRRPQSRRKDPESAKVRGSAVSQTPPAVSTTHPRYVAFLRGVSPTNASMPQLKACFESAGFADVKTVLSSGNIVFSTAAADTSRLEKQIEKEMSQKLDRTFFTIVRSVETLQQMLARDRFADFSLSEQAKRIVTFVRLPRTIEAKLPIKREGVQLLCAERHELFSVYVPGPEGPLFMQMIETLLGKDVTTRTWDTVKKCVRA